MSLERRDEHLRHSILTNCRVIGSNQPGRWVSGSKLAIAARDDVGQGCQDMDHAERLVNDLVSWSLLEERSAEDESAGTGKREFRHRAFKLTAKAFRLWNQEIAPIPGVYDRRAD